MQQLADTELLFSLDFSQGTRSYMGAWNVAINVFMCMACGYLPSMHVSPTELTGAFTPTGVCCNSIIMDLQFLFLQVL